MEAKIEKLKEVFGTMSYGENLEDTSEANTWLQTIEIVDKSSDIENILSHTKTGVYNVQSQIISSLARELEKNAGIIAQIEILSRGILSKDSRKAVCCLADYFYYYASLPKCNRDGKQGVAVGVFEDDHPLWLLGLFLGPALATGHTIVLQTGTKFAAVATFVLELAVKAGLPKDMLVLIPSNEWSLQQYLNSEKVVIMAIFIDILSDKCKGVNKYHKKLLVFSGYKTPMLVFDGADLDSAANCALEATWEYQGMLPWSIDTVFVQENVFKKFVEKVKNKTASLRIGNGDDKLADISYPSNHNLFQKLTATVCKAKSLGIEVFQKDTASNTFTPTLIIGSRVSTNNVLTGPENDSTLTILPFRSIDEAVNLANNTRQGLGASVWTESIGLINEVTRKLNVSNVWINSHGILAPEIPLTPLKDSGVGNFGGLQGLLEYGVQKVTYDTTKNEPLVTNCKDVEAVGKAIGAAKTASVCWRKTSLLDRLKLFAQFREAFKTHEKKLSELKDEKWIESFPQELDYVISHSNDGLISRGFKSGYSVASLKQPKGIIVIHVGTPIETYRKLLVAALFEGNAVILLNEKPELQGFYKDLTKILSCGVLTVLPYSHEAALTFTKYVKELNGYISNHTPVFGSLSLSESKLFALVEASASWEDIFNHVRTLNNVWSNVGQSSQCSL